jgi:hypothetical protein
MWGPPDGEHGFIVVGGKGYGYYAKSHMGGKPSSSPGAAKDLEAIVVTPGAVDDDTSLLMQPSSPAGLADGAVYVTRRTLYIGKCYDVDKFEKSLKTWLDAELAAHPRGASGAYYSVIGYNCYTFIADGVGRALKASQVGLTLPLRNAGLPQVALGDD